MSRGRSPRARRAAALAAACLIGLIAATTAGAAPAVVNVRIEGRGETLFEGPILTEGHDVKASSDTQERSCDGIDVNDPENVTPGPTPTAASVDAMSLIGESFDGDWYNSYDDYFITRWGPDAQNPTEGAYWGVLVNNVFTSVGGCQYELGGDDEVLWVYNAFAGKPLLALLPVAAGYTTGPRPLTSTAELGRPFEVEVLDYTDQKEDKPPGAPERAGSTPFEGADVSPVQTSQKGFETVETSNSETVKTEADGKASITFTTPGWHRIKATALNAKGEEEAIRSNRLDVCVPAQGASGCGEPPAEDQVRIPAHTEEEAKRQEEARRRQEEAKPGPGAEGESDIPPSTPGPTPPPTPAHKTSGPTALLTLEGITGKRLLLKLTAAGAITVQIARRVDSGHHARWRTVKTIAVRVGKAGRVEVKLPRLDAGRYRVRISLATANSVTKILTVPHG